MFWFLWTEFTGLYKQKHTHIQTYHFQTIWLFVSLFYFSFKSAIFFPLFLSLSLLGSVQNRSNQSKPKPSTHLSRPKPLFFRPFSSPSHTKGERVVERTFLLPLNVSFHTTHQVKLWPDSLKRNLKAILFLELESV